MGKTQSLLLNTDIEPGLAPRPVVVDGVAHYRFRKPIIRVGQYVKKATGQAFSVTRKHLSHWAETFGRMREAGVKVPVPVGHTNDAEKNRGWVEGMKAIGDELVADVDLVGDDAPRLVACSDVSVFIPPTHSDGQGNSYTSPITHVALVTDPVVTGLGDWVPLAASGEEDILVLTHARPLSLRSGSMDWTKIRDALGILGEVTDDNAEEVILAGIQKLQEELAKAKGEPPPEPKKEEPPSDGEDPKAVAASLRTNELLLSLAGDNRKMRLERLVASGKITPAVRDKVAAKFITGEALALSLSNGNDGFDSMLEILETNTPVSLSQATGAQVLPDGMKGTGGGMAAAVERFNKRFAKQRGK